MLGRRGSPHRRLCCLLITTVVSEVFSSFALFFAPLVLSVFRPINIIRFSCREELGHISSVVHILVVTVRQYLREA